MHLLFTRPFKHQIGTLQIFISHPPTPILPLYIIIRNNYVHKQNLNMFMNIMLSTPQCHKHPIQIWQEFDPIINLPTLLDLLCILGRYARHARFQCPARGGLNESNVNKASHPRANLLDVDCWMKLYPTIKMKETSG